MDMLILIHLLEEKEKLERRRMLKQLREMNDPFSLQEETFIKFFRLPKTLCWDFIHELEQHDEQPSFLPFVIRFISVLYFLAHGSYQKCVGNNYTLPVSQPTVSRNVAYICKLVVKIKAGSIRFPIENNDVIKTKIGFFEKFNIKGTIGAVDCTHIPLVAPKLVDPTTPAQLYMNRKGYYSVNVEAICDSDLRFLHVNAKFPGSCHDSGIWSTSNIRLNLIERYDPSISNWLLGDSGYPLEPWLLTPLSAPTTNKEKGYNKMHARARNVIERSFGVLKSRFRCLSNERKLHYSHEKVAYITYTCAILHNLLQENHIIYDESTLLQQDYGSTEVANRSEPSSDFLTEGRRVRKNYISSLEV